MALPYCRLSVSSLVAAMLAFLLIASVAAQGSGLDSTTTDPIDPFLGPPTQVPCHDGFGFFECIDASNCTSLSGQVSCCESTPEAINAKNNCAQHLSARADDKKREAVMLEPVCLTNMYCDTPGAHYGMVVAASQIQDPGTAFTVVMLPTKTPDTKSGAVPTEMTTSPVPASTFATLTTTIPLTPMPDSPQSSDEVQTLSTDVKGSMIAGITVGSLAGITVLTLFVCLVIWHCKGRWGKKTTRGVLPGARIPTGFTITPQHPSPGSDRYGVTSGAISAGHAENPGSYDATTLVSSPQPQYHAYSPEVTRKRETCYPGGPPRPEPRKRESGLQSYTESAYSQTDGAGPMNNARNGHAFDYSDDSNVSPFAEPFSNHFPEPRRGGIIEDPLYGSWPVQEDGGSLHRRASSGSLEWPLTGSTVSYPGLLDQDRDRIIRPPPALVIRKSAQHQSQPPLGISPMSPISPFGDLHQVKSQAEIEAEEKEDAEKEAAEREKHRQAAYKKLSGEDNQSGSVARARLRMMATRGAEEQQVDMPGPSRHTAMGIHDILRDLSMTTRTENEPDIERSETGTVIKRRWYH